MTDKRAGIILLVAIILVAGCSAMTTIVHDAGISWNYYGPFYTEGQAVWSDSTSPHGANAWLYDFMIETGTMANTGESSGNRAFAVRNGG